MVRQRIILTTPIESLPPDEQEGIFFLSRTNDVFVRGANEVLWRVLDLTDEDTPVDSRVNMIVRILRGEPVVIRSGEKDDEQRKA